MRIHLFESSNGADYVEIIHNREKTFSAGFFLFPTFTAFSIFDLRDIVVGNLEIQFGNRVMEKVVWFYVWKWLQFLCNFMHYWVVVSRNSGLYNWMIGYVLRLICWDSVTWKLTCKCQWHYQRELWPDLFRRLKPKKVIV